MSAFAAAGAIVTRDLRAVVRARSQVYSSVVTPLIFLVFLGVGVSEGLQPASLTDGDFTSYLVAGVVVMTAVFSSTFASASYYRDRESGLLRVLLASPHSARVILAGKSLASVVIGSLQSFVVFGAAAPFVDFAWQWGVFRGIAVGVLVIVLLNVLLAGLAQALASRISTMQGFHLLMNLALFPLLFFSGAFFPIDELPVWLEILARLNPLSYSVDALLVAAYAGNTDGYFGLWLDLPVLAGLAGAVYLFGLWRVPRLSWSGQ